MTLAALHDAASASEDPVSQLDEHRELLRQLGALRDRVARAPTEISERRELRAELDTLLSFAKMLRADAELLGARRREEVAEVVRRESEALHQRKMVAAVRQEALRRRDALQAKIVRTAQGIAKGDPTECRGTVPVVTFDTGVTVCSMGVASPKRRFRSRRFWLVTLTDAWDDVLVRPT